MGDPAPTSLDSRRYPVRLRTAAWFGLATTAVVVIATGLRIGIPVYKRHMAITEIERLGGVVETNRIGSAWVRGAIGWKQMRAFESVVSIDLRDRPCWDGALPHLSSLADVRSFGLSGTQITDAILDQICSPEKVEILRAARTRLTDGALFK